MNHLNRLLPFILTISISLKAQSNDSLFQPLPRAAVGVIHLSIFPTEGERKVTSKQISVRKSPSTSAPLLLILHSENDVLAAREIDYEHSAAVVFARKSNWYQIETRSGKGWISAKDSEGFIPVESLLRDKMSFIWFNEWNGSIFGTPSTSSKPIKIKLKRELPQVVGLDAEFLEWKVINGEPWIRVKLLAKMYCDDITVLKIDTIGWLPAYSSKGNLVMWFYSRGC